MTTRVVIEPASHPILVEINDHYRSPEGLVRSSYEMQLHLPGDPTIVLYATTTRTISVFDLEPDDPRVVKTEIACGKRKPETQPARTKGIDTTHG